MVLNWGYDFMHIEELEKFNWLEPAIEELGNYKLLYIDRIQPGYITTIRIVRLGMELSKLMEINKIEKSEIDALDDEFSAVSEIIERNKKLNGTT